MGKRQHQKDKMYITATEWATLYGGKKADQGAQRSEFKKLPFHCCSLSLQPFEHPLCTADGIIFDLMSIVPYLKKFGHNPITGEPLDAKTLIKLTFHKNAEGKYHCPVTFKVFNENSHIVAVKTTGNVYSYEAVERLNLKPRSFRDLITDEPFHRSDIITLQDPSNLEKFDMSQFHHIKHSLTVDDEEEERARAEPMFYLRTLNPEARAALEEFYKDYKPEKREVEEKKKATARTAAHYSTGAVASAFTSTVGGPVTENEAAIIDRDVLRYKQIKRKGYVRFHTSLGDLNLEVYCNQVPKTCENFLKHCRDGYYDDTVFHRSIRNFMIQGGDPTGTGSGGKSIWGKPFSDEFKPNLSHTGRGILSMANKGPGTNRSQFFITYRSCRHLDGKHAVFGRLVGGMDVLSLMEKVETDKEDSPLEAIRLTRVSVFVNPYEEVDAKLREDEQREDEEAHDLQPRAKPKLEAAAAPVEKPKVYRSGVGKYIQPSVQATPPTGPTPLSGVKRSREKPATPPTGPSPTPGVKRSQEEPDPPEPAKRKRVSAAGVPRGASSGEFGNFSGW